MYPNDGGGENVESAALGVLILWTTWYVQCVFMHACIYVMCSIDVFFNDVVFLEQVMSTSFINVDLLTCCQLRKQPPHSISL